MVRNLLFLLILLLGCLTCANIVPPKGGPQDKEPPKLIKDASTENYQTYFEKQDIEFTFDEFIELKDVFKQVVVSPPLAKPFKLTSRLKTATFKFHEDEVLRPDATYTINFGNAIVDYTQGNAIPDFRFVFSTGAAIDSMTVSGKIVDALTGDPAEEVLLLLYDNLADSVVRKERPFYFAKSGKDGTYTIENVKRDTFKAFAIKDEGLPYLFDQVQEAIGFPDSFIVLNQVQETLPDIGIFKEVPKLQLIPPNNKQYGKLNLVFNTAPLDVQITYDDVPEQVYLETEKDTLRVWYEARDSSTWNIYLQEGEVFRDTFEVLTPSKNNFNKSAKLQRSIKKESPVIQTHPGKPLRIPFNHPLVSIDTTQVLLLEDSIYSPVVPALIIEGKTLLVDYRWKSGLPYRLQITPGAIRDIYDLQNLDTVQQNYRIMERKNFGDVQLRVTDLDSTEQYVIQLYFQTNSSPIATDVVKGKTDFSRSYKTVPEGQYTVEVITDKNRNGRWDTGNYDRRAQPEPIFSKALEKLRANWEVNATVSIKASAAAAEIPDG